MAIPKLKKGDVIQIDWNDAWSFSGWTKTEDKDVKPLPVTSIGVFVASNKKGFILSFGFDSFGKSLCEHFVPLGMVVQIKKLVDSKKIVSIG